jgi:hypothetical protein
MSNRDELIERAKERAEGKAVRRSGLSGRPRGRRDVRGHLA